MKWLVEALERRDHGRVRRQLPCTFLVDGRSGSGTVREVSPHGLYLETRDEVAPGKGVVVAFDVPEGSRFVLEAWAPYRGPVAQSLATHISAGIGLRVDDPPNDYLRWVEATGASPS